MWEKNDICLKISLGDIKEGATIHLTSLKKGHLGCTFKAMQGPDCTPRGFRKSGSKGPWTTVPSSVLACPWGTAACLAWTSRRMLGMLGDTLPLERLGFHHACILHLAQESPQQKPEQVSLSCLLRTCVAGQETPEGSPVPLDSTHYRLPASRWPTLV